MGLCTDATESECEFAPPSPVTPVAHSHCIVRSLTLAPQVSIAWVAASGHPEVALTTTFRAYTDVAVLVFGQEYPLGGNGTKASTGRSGTGSLFPSWDLSASDSDGLDYFAGRDQSTMSGKFSEAKVGTGTQGTAVLAVFKAGATGPLRTLVTSPLSAFMASAFDLPSNLLKKSTVSGVGVLGSVTSIPAGFSIETAVVGGRGVADTLMDWGDVLLQRGGKTRTVQDHATDKSLTHIGYWTVSVLLDLRVLDSLPSLAHRVPCFAPGVWLAAATLIARTPSNETMLLDVDFVTTFSQDNGAW